MEKEIAEYTRRCLDDCGFSEEQKVQYLKYLESGQQNERLRLLQAPVSYTHLTLPTKLEV